MSVVYSPLKVFGFPDHLASTDGMLPAPIHVRIKPVNVCNQRCWYCTHPQDALAPGNEMNVRDSISRDKMLEIVEDLISMDVRAVTFSGGGEALIYPYLSEAVRRLGAAGIRVACFTNGWALRGEIAETLAEYATWVRVSIDAWDGASYAKSRGVPLHAFAAVIDNVDRFASTSERCELGFNFIVNRENAEHIAEFCAIAKAVGARSVKLSACVVSDEGLVNDAYHATIAEAVAERIATARRLEDERFSVVDRYHAINGRIDRPYRTCAMLQYVTVIGADCMVYTCQDKAYTHSGTLGSIKDRRFRELWRSWELAEHVRSFDPRVSCPHPCSAHTKNLMISEYRALDPKHAAFV